MADDNDWKSLCTVDKIEHKNWKARVEGYEAALKELQAADDGKDQIFNPYINIAKKMVIDTNAMAQEKALEVVEVFVADCANAGRSAFEVIPGIISKCLNATRPKTKEKAIEILKLYIEAEKHEIVLDELVKGLSLKAPKNVVGCIISLKESLRDFGPKVVPIKELFKHIPKLLEDRDKTVRECGKDLIIEIYKWIGRPAMEPMLSQLKSVQVTEVAEEFEKLKGVKASPCRYLKSQKPKEVPKPVADAGGPSKGDTTNVNQVDEDPGIDPYDLIDPVEVVKHIPGNFYQRVEEKKWTERRDALEEIDKLTNHPKLIPGDFGDLIKTIHRVIAKDTNVVLVAMGAKIIAQIATGIREKFSPYALDTLKICFEKFKERKVNVVKALRDCVDASFVTIKLDACAEDIQLALGHKTPSVRTETVHFINRIFERNNTIKQEQRLNKKNVKLLVSVLVKFCGDSVPEVRDSCFQALGTAMGVIGEKQLKPLIEGGAIDAVKMARIQESYEKFINGGSKPEESQANDQKPPAAPTAQSTPASTTAPKEEKKTSGPSKKGGVSAPGPPPKKGQPKTLLTNKGKGGKNADGPNVPVETEISEDDAILKMNDLMGEAFVDKLTDKNYKERLAAMEKIQSFVNEKDSSSIPSQVINKVLCVKPGLKDNNIMVLKMKIDVIKTVVSKSNNLTWTAVEFCIPDLTEKIGDVKNSVLVKSTLTEMSEVLDVGMVAEQVIKTASENVNIKNIIETLNWLGDCLQEFGYRIPMDKMLPFTKITLSHNSPIVRQASIKLVGIVSLFMRDAIGKMLESEKVSIKQLIDAEIENMKNTPTPVPIRGLKSIQGGAAGDGDCTDGNVATRDGAAAPPIDVDEMVPRDNISNRITDDLVNKFGDKSWKVKKEGYESLTSILTGHAGITGDGMANLLAAIAKNTTDSSAVIKKMALEVLANFAKLFSKKDCEKHARAVLPGILGSCADAKPKNRDDSVNALNLWGDKIGFSCCCDGSVVTDAMKNENPYLRATLITWMTPHLKKYGESKELKKSLYPDFGSEMMAPFFGCLEDRSPDVRKAAQEALVPLMTVLGFDQMSKFHSSNTKLASRENIKQFLEKAKEQLPKPASKQQATVQKKESPSEVSSAKPPKEQSKKDAAKTKTPKEDKKVAGGKSKAKTIASESSAPPGLVVSVFNKASNKRQRINDDRKKKLTQWEPNSMNIQQLESQFQGNCSPDLYSLLFSKDFKNFIKAIDMMSGFLSVDNEESIEATQQNLDIILKWSVIRFNETNPSVIFKCLDYLNKVFNVLGSDCDKKFQLHDQEAMSFLPDLCSKLGDSKDQVRNSTRSLLNTILTCYPENKVSQFLEIQLESKVARVRQESTDFLRCMIDERRLDVFNHRGLLKSIGQLVGERDNGVRTAALNCLVSAHNFMGEELQTLLYKSFTQKEKDMLEERIKRTGKPVGHIEDNTSITTTATTTRDSSNSRPSITNIQKSGAGKNGRDSSIGTSRLSTAPGVVTTTTQPAAPAPIDVNPLLKEDISNKLIDLQKDIEEINQPLQELKLRYTGRTNQTLNASDAIRGVISDISDSDTEKSIGAMAQIDEVIRNPDVCSQLKPHMEKLMQSISMKMSVTVGKLSEEPYNESEITDVFRVILATLMSVFGVKELAIEIPRSCLMELMDRLLNTVISEQLVSMSDGSGVVRGINVLSVRILDASDQTNMLSCLLRLMTECLRKGDSSSKYLHLLFKCIWSMTKNLNNTIKTINLLVIMKDINIFFMHFPPSKWESSQKDVPMRTVKTLIHSLITHNQGGILEIINQLPNGPNKELDSYIRKSYTKLKLPIPTVLPSPPTLDTLMTGGPGNMNYQFDYTHDQDNEMMPFLQRDGMSDSSKENLMLNNSGSSNMHLLMKQQQQLQDAKYSNAHSNKRPYLEELKQIFCKIGQSDETEQGLNDLYDFKSKYPYVDLDRYLRQTSGYFQKTIETGLKDIAAKRNANFQTSPAYFNNQSNNNGAVVAPGSSLQGPMQHNNGLSGGGVQEDSWASCSMDPDSLFKRLKNLRQRVGLDQTQNLSTSLSTQVLPSNQRSKVTQQQSSDNVDEMEVSFIGKLNASGDGPSNTDATDDKSTTPKPNRRMSSDEIANYRQRIAKIGKPL